jgi:3-oxo-5-alpha-steroid 4-dehydrogenase 1
MQWYTGNTFYDTLLIVGFLYALMIFVSSLYGTAAYGGRFGGGGAKSKGIKLGSKPGWILMELPGLIVFPIVFFMGENSDQIVPLFFLAIWMFHYTNRALVTPLLMRTAPGASQTFAFNVVVAGWITLFMHGYFNAEYIANIGTQYTTEWFSDPRFIIGIAIYAFGFTLNVYSDTILRNLRSKKPDPSEPRYKIPYGGFFKWVSCPQYLGEILSFTGFAIMTWNLGAVFVLAITVGNLAPRAMVTHKWFLKNFDDYPKERKALIPYIW